MSEKAEIGNIPALLSVLRATVFAVLPPSGEQEGPYSPVTEARKRLAAIDLLEETVEGWGMNLGSEEETRQVRQALTFLRRRMEGVKEAAVEVEAELGSVGVQLDPALAGGGKLHTGGRGAPPTLLSRYVRDLLLQRYPDWDGVSPFPGRNTQELRDWLHKELGGYSWHRPFDPEHISSGPREHLYRIVNNLQRLQ